MGATEKQLYHFNVHSFGESGLLHAFFKISATPAQWDAVKQKINAGGLKPDALLKYLRNAGAELHRTDGPALTIIDKGGKKVVYYEDDRVHRVDGPAMIFTGRTGGYASAECIGGFRMWRGYDVDAIREAYLNSRQRAA
jgi:hypothetical protein